MSDWTVRYEGYVPEEEGRREALCTLGNGYLATRGAAPESRAGWGHYPGTYVAGCYNRLVERLLGQPVENESLVNAPNWVLTTVRIGGDDPLSPDTATVLAALLELDLRRGVLTRQVRYRDAAGRTTRIAERRLVHMGQMHVAAVETTVTAEDWSGEVVVHSGIDGGVENTGVERYRGLAGRHWTTPTTEQVDPETVLLSVETTQSHVRLVEAARTRVVAGACVDRQVVETGHAVGHDLVFRLQRGARVTIEKVIALHTSMDRPLADPARAAAEEVAAAPGLTTLLASHAAAWRHLWDRFDIALPRHPEAQRAVRLHLFHLLQTVSPHTSGLDCGVPARGLHGEAYRGHIFWDELFVFPLITSRVPALARALLRYRWRRLPAARRAAHASGFSGAMFPWQSGSDGREESQRLHLNPRSGRWLPDPTFRQRHVNIAIAYNIWQLYESTGDDHMLDDFGAELFLEIALFLASLARFDRARGRYVIPAVVGPDEFHTGYPGADETGVDNNAYTNVMTVWVLLRALELLDRLPAFRRRELVEAIGLHADELERWRHITTTMYVPMRDDGLVWQFEGYGKLAELDWDAYRARYGDIQRLDRILESEGDSANRYQVSKQADVLMLPYLLTSAELAALFERLGYRFEEESLRRCIDYYLRRTCHGSTLSAVVHTWVLARVGAPEALDFLTQALRSDIADIQGGTTAEGIHLAAMAGSVDLVQRCFAGIHMHAGTLWVEPLVSPVIGAIRTTLLYRGQTVEVSVMTERLRVTLGKDARTPVRCGVPGQLTTLEPGQAVEVLLGPRARRQG